MKILTLNNEFPPVGGGASIMSYQLTRELVRKNHTVDVVTVPRAALSASDEVLPGAVKAAGILQLPDETALVIDMLWMSLGAELANLLGGDAVTPASGEPQ